MENFKANKKNVALYLIALYILVVVTSCKKTGEHYYFCPNTVKQTNIENPTAVVNTDSIVLAKDQAHKEMFMSEHRVYYVDFSYSMIEGKNKNVELIDKTTGETIATNKDLLTLVKESLKQSIRNIQGENVCIEIIPFLDSELWKNGKPTDVFRIVKGTDFNNSELKKMDEFIDNISTKKNPKDNTHYDTHHSIAINDFIENRISNENQYHMMILLTDGVDEFYKPRGKALGVPSGVKILQEKWLNIPSNYVFGIYADLNNNVRDSLAKYFIKMEDSCENSRLYHEEGLDFDYNVFILESELQVMHRSNKIAYVAIAGEIPTFEPIEQKDEHYKYTIVEQPTKNSKYIKIQVDTLTHASKRPNKHIAKLTYDYVFSGINNNPNSKFIPSGSTIELTIIDEKTPNIKFILPNSKKESIPCITKKLNYCKRLCGVINPEWSDTVTIRIPYEKSNDAKYKEECNTIKLSINGIPEYAELLTPREVYLDKPMDTLLITFALKPSHESLDKNNNFKGEFIVEDADDFKAVFVNGLPLDSTYSSNIIGTYEIEVNKCWHPLLVSLFWLLILVLILYLLYLIIVSWIIHKKPKFTDKIPAIQFITDPATSYKNLSPDYFDFKNKGHLYEHIDYLRFDSSIRTSQHKTYNIFNPLGIDRTLKGNIYIYPLESNIFAKSIELRPEKGGDISVYVDKIKKIDIKKIELYYPISEINENNTLYKLKIKGYKPTC